LSSRACHRVLRAKLAITSRTGSAQTRLAPATRSAAREARPWRPLIRSPPLSISFFEQVEGPLRSEPFSAEHLCEHAERLAGQHELSRTRREDRRFIDRFQKNSRFIASAYQTIADAVRDGEPVSPDAEWLIDNYHIVEEQLREIREDLPRRFYRELPKLASGPWSGFPRIYELAYELITHTDSSLDEDILTRFIAGYQRGAPLSTGELWAFPIMLRLVLVENLRRLCGQILDMRGLRRQARDMLATWPDNGEVQDAIAAVQRMPPLALHVVECVRESNDPQHACRLREIEDRLSGSGMTIDDMIRSTHQHLAANQVSIGNLITSMRLLNALDWTHFFEHVSLVEEVLRQDPAGVYAHMDFATRDLYRHEVEAIAKRMRGPEVDVARRAIELCSAEAHPDAAQWRERHVGFYLIDRGRSELERSLRVRPKLWERLGRAVRREAAVYYLGGIAAITLALAVGVGAFTYFALANIAIAIGAVVLAALPASDIAVALVNYCVTKLLRPKPLPKVEFKERIPPHCQTIVVVPSMLTSASGVRRLLERIEVHYLTNPEHGLQFALLTDFADAPERTMPEDDDLVDQATAGILALNERYSNGQDRFLLLHRRRHWSEADKIWMGWERKRGKLVEFNRLLRGAADTSFAVQVGALTDTHAVRYVITLDTDTRLPHAAARQLIGTLAHPLNRARFDAHANRVVEGYGILQPRVGISLVSARRSPFASIFAHSPGIDPYCTAVSDVYQDLFGEGSFTGKGIYDVDAFMASEDGVFPENHILSHDLIEGCHARVGLVTDVEVFDEYPSRYDAEARRQHRWVRGDWQLLPWLAPTVPTEHARRRNPLSAVSLWKIFDNLRRSTVPPVLLAALVAAWCSQALALPATIAAAVVIAFPLIIQACNLLVSWPRGIDWRQHLREALGDLARTAAQCGLQFCFLPYRAYLMADAIVRTVHRLYFSRQRLLEWETADAAERRFHTSRWSCVREMWFAPACSLAIVLAFAVIPALPVASLVPAAAALLLWFVSPLVAEAISRPYSRKIPTLAAADREVLRHVARKTWSFFERFVAEEDQWLPPDNHQEIPKPKIAHRISPTNAGLFIVSAMAARDFRHIGLGDLAAFLERNLDTLERLERYRGHFYNWYDTTNLRPLPPRYLSTADSGNMAACLLTAHQALDDLAHEPLLGADAAAGLLDTVTLAEEALARIQPKGARFVEPTLDALEAIVRNLRQALDHPPSEPIAWRTLLDKLHAEVSQLPQYLAQFEQVIGVHADELGFKLRSLATHVTGMQHDAATLLAWTALFAADSSHAPWRQSLPAALDEMLSALQAELVRSANLTALRTLDAKVAPQIAALRSAAAAERGANSAAGGAWCDELTAALASSAHAANVLANRLERLARQYESLALEMDFALLYNAQRRLFTVGYNLDDGRPDRSHYDLLASEARMASLIAIAKGDADYRHWFQLGRTLTQTAGEKSLLSWGGTMFEFLMPTLFARDIAGSLLDQSCRAAVKRQIEYARQRHVPWGISESAFGAMAANSDYHYQSFGVPGLGLKRGLAKDLVISPYSTALASPLDPAAAVQNFKSLSGEGGDGPWGYYDALDYTADRVPPGRRNQPVACYMAHHHGMTVVAIANCLLDAIMQRRFGRHPLSRAIDLLLQERVPIAVLQFQPHGDDSSAVPVLPELAGPVSRRLATPNTSAPRTHILSNGQYSVMLTNAGGGYSSCGNLAVTRWRSDTTRDNWGQFIYLRDLSNNAVWSAAYQPTRRSPFSYEVTFSLDKAEFRRRDGDLETHLEICISPESNVELRHVTITNHGAQPVTIEVTSYSEVVLAAANADAAHLAFSKLFIETEYLQDHHALVARRRPRDATQPPQYAVHALASRNPATDLHEYETDRAKFIGRGRNLASPAALDPGARLSGTIGPVLDPVFSLRGRLTIAPEESQSLSFITATADSRDEAVTLADRYHDMRVVQRTFELAWAHGYVEMRHLHIPPETAQLHQRLASAILYPDAAQRAPSVLLETNRLCQPGLWRHGISGDDPVVLLRLTRPDQRTLLREVLMAHESWHLVGLKVDLVVLNEHAAGYFDTMYEQLLEMIQTTTRVPMNKPGGVYLLRGAHLSDEDKVLLESVAAISLHGERGPLERQFRAAAPQARQPARLPSHSAAGSSPLAARATSLSPATASATAAAKANPQSTGDGGLECANEFGGFDSNGREYVIRLAGRQQTPLPWSNVVANEHFGFLITESGGGYTWSGNSRENKLTAWSNDPVCDTPGEAIYLRDEETGDIWSPTPLPVRDQQLYEIRHGHGYSRFLHTTREIASDLLVSLAGEDHVKCACIKLRNTSARRRTLSATYYCELVLGVSRDQTRLHIQTAIDESTGALVVTNHYNGDFPNQLVFLHAPGRTRTVTGDRTEFLGRNRSPQSPAALERTELSGTVGAGLDPCAALQTRIELAPGEEVEVIFLFGQCDAPEELAGLLARYSASAAIHAAIDQTKSYWEQMFGAVQVKTPSRALDLLVNAWLPYQTLSCRVWGRSAFYQSGGAYGFRDQLQDVMALVYSVPQVARAHILRASAHQFEEGDVQHWWHPPIGRGVRTRFADDYLWLPLVVCHYVQVTGDRSVLDERAGYLRVAPLEPHEEERYETPQHSDLSETIYEHCLRAIEHGFRFGEHGLPLMGTGDWNDGMNKVGAQGKGESVWMGWFFSVVLTRFAALAESRGESDRVTRFRDQSAALLRAVDEHGWDGHWYRRAYFDDGTPLGSAQNDECRIDSIAQSWSVIAGGDTPRNREAMQALDQMLVRRNDRVILLLDPPFDKTALDPGYIKGYLPGIRENGGQYTHAALWVVKAWALLGDGDRAFEMFDLINPITHAERGHVDIYRVEPYVVTADVYGLPPHVGRGGWSWYTGSASWMYRVALESILGFELHGDRLRLRPSIPNDWPGFEIHLQRGAATWHIIVNNSAADVTSTKVDGQEMKSDEILLADDGRAHSVQIDLKKNK
jgi:cyclic beta-1,2-glucan synthetase